MWSSGHLLIFLGKMSIQILYPFLNWFFWLLSCKSSLCILTEVPYMTCKLQVFSPILCVVFFHISKLYLQISLWSLVLLRKFWYVMFLCLGYIVCSFSFISSIFPSLCWYASVLLLSEFSICLLRVWLGSVEGWIPLSLSYLELMNFLDV